MSDTKTIRVELLRKGDVLASGHIVEGIFRVENKAGPYDHFVYVYRFENTWHSQVATRDAHVCVMTGLPRFRRWLESLSTTGVYAPSFIMKGLQDSFV